MSTTALLFSALGLLMLGGCMGFLVCAFFRGAK